MVTGAVVRLSFKANSKAFLLQCVACLFVQIFQQGKAACLYPTPPPFLLSPLRHFILRPVPHRVSQTRISLSSFLTNVKYPRTSEMDGRAQPRAASRSCRSPFSWLTRSARSSDSYYIYQKLQGSSRDCWNCWSSLSYSWTILGLWSRGSAAILKKPISMGL